MAKRFGKTHIVLLSAMLALVLLAVTAYFAGALQEEKTAALSVGASWEAGILSDGQSMTQVFTMPQDNLFKLTLRAAFKNGKPETGTLAFILKDAQGGEVFAQTLDVTQMRNNAPFALTFDSRSVAEGQDYSLSITAQDVPSQTPVSLMGTDAETIGTLTLPDGTRADMGALFLSLTGHTTTHPIWFTVVLIILAVCLLPALIVAGNKKEGMHA